MQSAQQKKMPAIQPNTLYITEPKAINVHLVKELLPAGWKVIEGNTSFTGSGLNDCSVMLIRSATTITPAIKEVLPKLRHIIRAGVGVDNIDMEFCTREGIAVYNAPGANADAVSDYVIGMMFHALRNTHLLNREDIASWKRFKFTGHSMASRRIGIIGFGNIGKQIFTKLQSFNCQAFFVYDPFIKREDMPTGVTYAASVEDVLRQSDIVTLHVPLLPTTKYLINSENLGLMPEDAILINASRGGVVNETAVIAYMQNHKLTYVADTVEGEPQVSTSLLDAPNAIVTPHIASLTKESDDNIIRVALDNFLAGQAMNQPATHTS